MQMMKHKITRESDEYACTCGLRWGDNEADPHPIISGFDPAQSGGDRSVEATYENGKMRLDSIRKMIKD